MTNAAAIANSGASAPVEARSGDTGAAANLVVLDAFGGDGGDVGVALPVAGAGGAALNVVVAGVASGPVTATGGSSVATAVANGAAGGTAAVATTPTATSGASGGGGGHLDGPQLRRDRRRHRHRHRQPLGPLGRQRRHRRHRRRRL